MPQLIHCIYASTATPAFSEPEIPALLDKARAKNGRLGITGMLLYIEGSFFQVLEGDEPVVARTFDEIKADPRHMRITEIIREPIARRAFSDWTMGYASIGRGDVDTLVGDNGFFNDPRFLERLSPGRAKRLLLAFRGGSWRSDETGAYQARTRTAASR